MNNFYFTSILEEHYLQQLEEILFFNPRQCNIESRIRQCVERYGLPEIDNERGRLRVRLSKRPEVQSLYMIDRGTDVGQLRGVLTFLRESEHELVIAHLAVNDLDRRPNQTIAPAMLAWAMIAHLRGAATRVRGITHIALGYSNSDEPASLRSQNRGRRSGTRGRSWKNVRTAATGIIPVRHFAH